VNSKIPQQQVTYNALYLLILVQLQQLTLAMQRAAGPYMHHVSNSHNALTCALFFSLEHHTWLQKHTNGEHYQSQKHIFKVSFQ